MPQPSSMRGVELPRGFAVGVHRMRVTYADGSPFHGAGVRLSFESHPSAADLAAGTDRELVDALQLLGVPGF